MATPSIDFSHLTVSERIQLVEDIWDSIAECPEALALTEAQREELDRRLDAHEREPDAGSPWPVVREETQSRR